MASPEGISINNQQKQKHGNCRYLKGSEVLKRRKQTTHLSALNSEVGSKHTSGASLALAYTAVGTEFPRDFLLLSTKKGERSVHLKKTKGSLGHRALQTAWLSLPTVTAMLSLTRAAAWWK